MRKTVLAALLLAAAASLAGCGGSAPPGNGATVTPTPSQAASTSVPAPTTSATVGPFPTYTTHAVPAPAPCPWPNVPTYTEQTYEIDVKVGQDFAIGMFANTDFTFGESHDTGFLDLLGKELIPYDPPMPNKYGTEWFLYKATKAGNANITYNYPIEYIKAFKVIIH